MPMTDQEILDLILETVNLNMINHVGLLDISTRRTIVIGANNIEGNYMNAGAGRVAENFGNWEPLTKPISYGESREVLCYVQAMILKRDGKPPVKMR